LSMRPFRTVDLSFGLVCIPTQVYTLQVDRSGSGLGSYCPDCRGQIGLRRYCKACGKTFHTSDDPFKGEGSARWQDIAKGVDAGGRVVVIESHELDEIKPPSSREVAIKYFVPVESLSRQLHLYVHSVYLLRAAVPKRGRSPVDNTHYRKALSLLREVMARRRVVGVAKVCLSAGREHYALVWPDGKNLLLLLLRYESEVRVQWLAEAEEDYEGVEPSEEELKAGEMLVESMIRPSIEPVGEDAYVENLKKLIQAKVEGVEPQIQKPEPSKPTLDLVAALKASISQAAKQPEARE